MYLGESRRAVCFRRFETAVAERRSFVRSVASVFEDVFGGDEELPSLLVQVKSEEWGGEFVDLKSDATIPDRSVLRVVVEKCKVSLNIDNIAPLRSYIIYGLKATYGKVTRELFAHGEVLTNNLLEVGMV